MFLSSCCCCLCLRCCSAVVAVQLMVLSRSFLLSHLTSPATPPPALPPAPFPPGTWTARRSCSTPSPATSSHATSSRTSPAPRPTRAGRRRLRLAGQGLSPAALPAGPAMTPLGLEAGPPSFLFLRFELIGSCLSLLPSSLSLSFPGACPGAGLSRPRAQAPCFVSIPFDRPSIFGKQSTRGRVAARAPDFRPARGPALFSC